MTIPTDPVFQTRAELVVFTDHAKSYRDAQADMIAKREAKDAAIAAWREAETRFGQAGEAFRRASEALGDQLITKAVTP